MKLRARILAVAVLGAIAASAVGAKKTHAESCPPSDVATELAYMRRLSFDLRGRAPSFEELESVATTTKRVEPQAIDAMLGEEAYIRTMRAFFRDLLAVNLAADFTGDQFNLVRTNAANPVVPPSGDIYWNINRSMIFRGGNRGVPCRNVAATFGPDGQPTTELDTEYGSGAMREGYVLVHPYWAADPTKLVKVCAFDASSKLVSTLPATAGQKCDETTFARDCGCGPDGRVCHWYDAEVPNGSTVNTLNRSFVEQALRVLDAVVRDDAPYTDILTSTSIDVDGPIVHFFKWQARSTTTLSARPDVGFAPPDLPYGATTWVPVTQQGRIAGILTSPFYLVKYSSNRGRANRFYNAFLCSYFQASAAGLPDPSDTCTQEPNITKRCGCKDCHATLEPSASYWGRWAERGIHPLPTGEYPRLDPACAGSNPPASCSKFRLVEGEVTHASLEPYKGVLRPFVFAEPFEANIESGPAVLAKSAIDSGQLAACTTKRMFGRFVGREPRDYPDERAQLERVAKTFADGYRLRTLVRELVALPQYKGEGR